MNKIQRIIMIMIIWGFFGMIIGIIVLTQVEPNTAEWNFTEIMTFISCSVMCIGGVATSIWPLK